ncbi:MAG: pyruvate dehydrogenase [Planctomycetes bacterium]|nr:pyruvate dehydrogenase [Planctomycetota bacterium]
MPARPVGIDRRLVAKALTIRRTEERLLDLFSQGQISGTVHTCIGQEWVGVAVAEQLRPGDFLFSNHRGHGHYLAWTDDVEGLLAELMGRATGVCGGRGGSQHLCRDGFFSNGIQGGTVPVAAGLAMAQSLDGGTGIAVVFVGDGTLGEGVVYETLNIAARWSLPLLVVIEDNGIAQSTARTETLAGDVPGRAAAFGLDYLEATTDEPVELLAAAGDAVRCVREARRPLVLHVRTRRLRPHSKGDDTRDPAALAALAAGDPLTRVLAPGSPVVRELLTAIDERLDAAVARAAAAPVAGIAFSAEARDGTEGRLVWQPIAFSPRRVVDAIRYALADGLERDDRIVLLGEDLGDPYGGAFKITAGLSSRFDGRVLNTPISEAAIVGIGSGLAMAGWRPVVEIMFGDFLMLAADQIVNHAAKFAWMYDGKVRVPLVIRTPMGGYRGYGPTHSQSLEKHLLGLPGTRVVAVTHRYCPGLMYRALLEGNDRPTLVVENKLLYGRMTDPTPPPGRRIEASAGEFPTVRIAPPGECQLTVVAYGGMVPLAESAARVLHDDEDLACELLIPTQLYPLDLTPVVESVRRTGRLLVVEGGQGFAGFAGELIAQVAIEGGPPARFARVCAGACPIPAARSAEQQALPDVERILTSAKNLALA